MSAIKLNFSLDEQVAVLLRQRAAELNVPASRYLADLVLQDVRRQQDLLAAEGYAELSADTADFASAAFGLARQTWPMWEQAQNGSEPTVSQDAAGADFGAGRVQDVGGLTPSE